MSSERVTDSADPEFWGEVKKIYPKGDRRITLHRKNGQIRQQTKTVVLANLRGSYPENESQTTTLYAHAWDENLSCWTWENPRDDKKYVVRWYPGGKSHGGIGGGAHFAMFIGIKTSLSGAQEAHWSDPFAWGKRKAKDSTISGQVPDESKNILGDGMMGLGQESADHGQESSDNATKHLPIPDTKHDISASHQYQIESQKLARSALQLLEGSASPEKEDIETEMANDISFEKAKAGKVAGLNKYQLKNTILRINSPTSQALSPSWPIPLELCDALSDVLDINAFFDAIKNTLSEDYHQSDLEVLYICIKNQSQADDGTEKLMRTTIKRSLPKTLKIFLRDVEAAPNWKDSLRPKLEVIITPELNHEDLKRKREDGSPEKGVENNEELGNKKRKNRD